MESKSQGWHSLLQPTTEPPHRATNPLVVTVGLQATISAWFSLLAAAMTRFSILSLYLHAIAPAPRHVRVVWTRGHGWPQGRSCLHWSRLTLLGTGLRSCNTQCNSSSKSCHQTNVHKENEKCPFWAKKIWNLFLVTLRISEYLAVSLSYSFIQCQDHSHQANEDAFYFCITIAWMLTTFVTADGRWTSCTLKRRYY